MKPSTAKYWLNFYTHTQAIIFDRWAGPDGANALIGLQFFFVIFGGMIIGIITSTEKLTDAQGWELYGAVNALPLACYRAKAQGSCREA